MGVNSCMLRYYLIICYRWLNMFYNMTVMMMMVTIVIITSNINDVHDDDDDDCDDDVTSNINDDGDDNGDGDQDYDVVFCSPPHGSSAHTYWTRTPHHIQSGERIVCFSRHGTLGNGSLTLLQP